MDDSRASRIPSCAKRITRRGKAVSVSDSGQMAVQVPQLKQALTSAAPKRLMSGYSPRSTLVAGTGVVVAVIYEVLPVGSYWK